MGARGKRDKDANESPPTATPMDKAPLPPPRQPHGGLGVARGSYHLVTRAEMMSVMVALTSASISSTGPGMGSCWHRCSALRICCRFCQMISANFSHLHGSPGHREDNGVTPSPGLEAQRLQSRENAPRPSSTLTQQGSAPKPPLLTTEQSRAECPAFQERGTARGEQP